MAKAHDSGLTKAELAFWERAFLEALPDCLRVRKSRADRYCAHLAAEVANAAVSERKRASNGTHAG